MLRSSGKWKRAKSGSANFRVTSTQMFLSNVVSRLHLDQARYRTLKFKTAFIAGVELIRRRGGRANQRGAVVVKRIDQSHKAASLILIVLVHTRDILYQHRGVLPGNGHVVTGA